METKSKPPKEKRRNNEKRKEKSRDAARSRRSKETEIFSDLANALPITSEQISQLDKASIMRLAIAYFKVRSMVELLPTSPKEPDRKSINDGSLLLKSLEGFAIVLSPEGDIIYVSENVSNYLGILQIDLMGQNIFEYSHPCDHEEIRDAISCKGGDSIDVKSLFIRLKCTLTSKGRSVNLKSATYKVIHCSGHMIKRSKDLAADDAKAMTGCFFAVGQPIPHPSNIEAPLPRQTFLTKHSLDMKFIHADDEFMKNTLGYEPDDLLDKSFYNYPHAMDSDAIFASYKCLFSKGQCETPQYRFLAKNGGYVWVVTQATLLYDKVQKPQSIVSVNYVLSGLECKDEIYAAFQVRSVKTTVEDVCDGNNNLHNIPNSVSKIEEEVLDSDLEELSVITDEEEVEEINHNRKPISNTAKLFGFLPAKTSPVSEEEEEVEQDDEGAARPKINTSLIFGPRTKDMNKGFLTFSEEKPGLTMLKDEPDDLTHLAPVPGDVCVPLDDHPFLSDVLDDILLKDNNFAPLLAEEPSDPFISYRDHDPSLLSPNLSKASDSLPSLSSPSDSLLDDDHMSTFMTLHLEEESEMSLKAPYIPMELTDDLPLLMPSELMWNGGEKKKQQEQYISGVVTTDNNSSLAHLLSTSLTSKQKTKDCGGCSAIGQQDHTLDIFGEKIGPKTWSSQSNTKSSDILHNKLDRAHNGKRSSTSMCEQPTKRAKSEPKEKMSSELLQQLMSNNHHRGRPKGRSNWLLDSGGQKAACISQPSESVLMNLLDPTLTVAATPDPRVDLSSISQLRRQRELIMANQHKQVLRQNSITLLQQDNGCFASLMDLTPYDFEVNAPVQSLLLQGQELLSALEANRFS